MLPFALFSLARTSARCDEHRGIDATVWRRRLRVHLQQTVAMVDLPNYSQEGANICPHAVRDIQSIFFLCNLVSFIFNAATDMQTQENVAEVLDMMLHEGVEFDTHTYQLLLLYACTMTYLFLG